MTFAELITAIRQGVEDINSTLYSDAEVLRAANRAIESTVTELRNYDPQFKLVGKTEIIFGSDDKEIALPTNFESILYVEDDLNRRINIISIVHKDDPIYDLEKYIYMDQNGQWFLGRRKEGDSETLNIWYKSKIVEEASVSSTTSMTFLSQPTDALVQTRAELILLGNRNRASRIKEIEENRLRGIIFGNMIGNLPEPELISFIDPEF